MKSAPAKEILLAAGVSACCCAVCKKTAKAAVIQSPACYKALCWKTSRRTVTSSDEGNSHVALAVAPAQQTMLLSPDGSRKLQ